MFGSFTGSFKFGRRKKYVAPAANSWTGTTSGLVFNLLNAPSSGTTWSDATGNGYNATLNGSPTYVATNNGGIKLNNADYTGTDYISVPYNIGINTITVEVVASFNPTSQWATIWGNDSYTAQRGMLAFMNSSTNITWGRPSATNAATITTSNSIRQWIFVMNNGSLSLYLNGTQVGTTASRTTGLYATGNFYFGARHTNDGTGATDKMNSSVSANLPVFYQMRLYNKALSGAEITANYDAVKTTYGI